MSTIAIVGDVHGQWSHADKQALESLGVDLALFVGDFGNEDVSIVQQIATVSLPKAVILGNHDAWYTSSKRNRKKCPYDFTKEDRVQQQLQALGE
ncbi:MAG: metallophosphoesterase, partial [Cyanobacteria bacterium P01_F01_bin.116]